MDIMYYIWIAAIVVFGILEAGTVTLVSVWFIGGALAALIAALLGGALWLQITLFFVVSVALLVAMKPLVRRFILPEKARTNADRLLGQEALVTEDVDNLRATGAVKINGVIWSARSEHGERIPCDSLIRITRMEGAKVYVEPVAVAAATE